MISLITTRGTRGPALFVPGVGAASVRKAGAPSGERPQAEFKA
jgi:hypothetical protein